MICMLKDVTVKLCDDGRYHHDFIKINLKKNYTRLEILCCNI
jgi:hypothetical protein